MKTPILLHPTQPRCATEGRGCRLRLRCARAMAAPGQHELVDYAAGPGGNTALCEGLFSFDDARRDAGNKYSAAAKAKLTGSAA